MILFLRQMLTFQNFADLSILFCKEIHKKILILTFNVFSRFENNFFSQQDDFS